MVDILSTLHGLSGNTLGEMFHSLNQVIKNQNNDIIDNMDYILENYNPKNDLEKVVKIRLIDHAKYYDEVLNAFKSNDTFYISQALQCSWFFNKSNVDAEYLVESIFPQMSFSTRMKVLKKYSKLLKDSFFAESLLNLVKERYGMRVAMILLPACGEDFIKNVLKSVAIKIPVSIILPIFDNYPSVIISFLTSLLERCSQKNRVSRTCDLYTYEHIFPLIAAKEPSTFAMLTEKYDSSLPYFKLGKRVTRHFVKKSYESLKNNFSKYGRLVKWKNVISNLTHGQVAELQLSMMPNFPYEFMRCNDYTDFICITADLKDIHKQKILMSCYEKKYGRPITADLNELTIAVAKRLPEDVCEKWIEQKLPAIDDQYRRGEYIMHLSVEKSIPLFKKMIEIQSDVNMRGHYVSCMFKSVLNKGKYQLVGSMCEYVIKRLRNDTPMIKDNVFRELLDCGHLVEIPLECWVPIEELYNIMFLQNESKGYLSTIIEIISVQIHSRFLNGLPVESYLEKIQKNCNLYYNYDCCSNTPFHKQCLLWFIEHFPYKEIEAKEDIGRFVTLFSRICEWNSKNPNNIIESCEWEWNKIEYIFSGDNDYHKVQIFTAIRKDNSVKCKFYDVVFPLYTEPSILIHKLIREPQTVASISSDLLRRILNGEITSYKSFFKRTRFYSKFHIPELFCTYCINVLHEDGGDNGLTSKKNAMFVLSILLPTNKFVEIISEYYPEKSVADDYSDIGIEQYEMQSQIALCFKNVESPLEVLESVRKFAKGDYLKLVVGVLAKICLHSPECKILPLLNEWLDCPISLRKHFLRAYFKISPLNKTLEMIVGLFEKETNVSLRFVLFTHAIRFFRNEPTMETFGVLKTLVGKLKATDEQCIDHLFISSDNICIEFISQYLQLLWDVVSILNQELAAKKRNKILNLVDADLLVLLEEGFCDVLLKQAFEEGKSVRMDLKIFAVRYLLYSINEQQLKGRIEKLMVELDRFFSKWNDSDLRATNIFKSRNVISYIMNSLVREGFTVKNYTLRPIDVIMMFKSALLTRIKEEDLMFEDLLIFEMSTIFLSKPMSSEIFIDLSEFIESILDKSISNYDVSVIEYFVSAINKVFMWIPVLEQTLIRVNFVEVFLTKPSKHCHLLALKLIPTSLTNHSKKYIEILKTCLKTGDATTKIHVNKLILDLTNPNSTDNELSE